MSRKLIKHADLFDGKNEKLKEKVHIVIEDNLVKEIVSGDISEENFDEIIDASGLIAIPGLTDAHVHVSHNIPDRNYEARVDEMAVRSTRVAIRSAYKYGKAEKYRQWIYRRSTYLSL